MRPAAALSLALALALVPGLLPACGGDDEEPAAETTTTTEAPDEEAAAPEAYAADVCGSIEGWREELTASAGGLEGQVAGSADPTALKEVLVDFLDGAVESTEDLVDDIDDAGVPEGEDGEALAEDLSDGLVEVRGLFEDSRDEVAALPSDDAEALSDGVSAVGEDLTDSSLRISEAFSRIGERVAGTELGDAFLAEPACEGLTEEG